MEPRMIKAMISSATAIASGVLATSFVSNHYAPFAFVGGMAIGLAIVITVTSI